MPIYLSYLQEMETPFFDPNVKRPLVLDCSRCSSQWMHGWAEIKGVLPVPQQDFFSKKTKSQSLTHFLPSHLHVCKFPFPAKNFSPKYLLFLPCSLATSLGLSRELGDLRLCSLILVWSVFSFMDTETHQKLEGLSVWSHTFPHLKQLLLFSLFLTGFVWCGVQLT